MLTSQHCDPFCLSSPHKTYLYQYRLQQSESIEKETVAWTLSMSSQTCLRAVYTARDMPAWVLSSLKTYYKIHFESYVTSAYSESFQTLLSKRKVADIIFKQQMCTWFR